MQIFFLTGYMGSGKSYWGRNWAAASGLPFFETDDMIQAAAGCTISEIFETKGEDYFRQQERAVLQSILGGSGGIVSTGGGMPCFFDNMKLMNSGGITIYLRATPAQLAGRLLTARKKRPLISNVAPENLEAFIAEKLALRSPFYEQSQLTLDVHTLSIDRLMELSEKKQQ